MEGGNQGRVGWQREARTNGSLFVVGGFAHVCFF